MDWKIVRQCEYRGWTIIDTGYAFRAFGPCGKRLRSRCSVDEIMEEIDERED